MAKRTDITNTPTSTLLYNKIGNFFTENFPRLSSLGNTIAINTNIDAAITPKQKKVIRHPIYRPITRPSGKHITIATEEPVAIVLNPSARLPLGTIRTARGDAIDQKMGQWKFSGDKHKSLQVDTERTFHQRYPLAML